MSRLAPVAALSAMFLSGPVLAIAGAAPSPGSILLVVTPPGLSVAVVAARAGARPVDPFDAFMGGLVAAEEGRASPDLAAALREAGAWLVLDGSRLAAICGVAA